MKRITHVVLMFALAAVGSSSALGQKALAKGGKTMTSGPQATAVAEEILQLERMYDQAFIRPTAEEMERLHTDDFMMTARGKVTTRAELLARLNDPNHRRDVIESLTTDDGWLPWRTTRRLPPQRSRSNQTRGPGSNDANSSLQLGWLNDRTESESFAVVMVARNPAGYATRVGKTAGFRRA